MLIGRILILFCVISLFSSCRKDVSVPEILPADSIVNLCFTYSKDIYFLEEFQSEPIQITNTPDVYEKRVRMSYDGEKFAYIINDTIQIINKKGEVIDNITAYNNIQQFDWCSNNETIYILANGSLYFHGPTVYVPAITIPISVPENSSTQLISVSISAHGDIAYLINWKEYSSTSTGSDVYGWSFVRKSNDETINITTSGTGGYSYLNQINFTGENDFTTSYTDWLTCANHNIFKGIEGIEENNMTGLRSPIYRSSIGLAFGYFQSKSDPVKYYPVLMDSNGKIVRSKKTLTSNGNDCWLDWK